MQFDISRDQLDGIALQQPAKSEGSTEININGGMPFLPSSPDKTMHTAIVSLTLQLKGQEQPFARGGWRILFTSSEAFNPAEEQGHPFTRQLLMLGTSKVIAQINNLCMHANLPLLPFDAAQFAKAAEQQRQQNAPGADAAPPPPGADGN